MAKIIKKATESSPVAKAVLPTISDEIFKLKIDEDSQSFFIDEKEDYGTFTEILIRPFELYSKIVAYTEEFKVKAESTLFHKQSEATDTWGNSANGVEGKICGRVLWPKLMDGWSDYKKEENKKRARYYALIFGVGSVAGKEPILIDFRIGGMNYMPTVKIINKLEEDKGDINKAEIRFKLTKGEKYPTIEIMPDFSRELPMTGVEPFVDAIEAYVQQHNEGILKKAAEFKKYKAAK